MRKIPLLLLVLQLSACQAKFAAFSSKARVPLKRGTVSKTVSNTSAPPNCVPVGSFPEITKRVFRRKGFWQIPVKVDVGSKVSFGRKRLGVDRFWIMEYVNTSSNDPKWAIRASRSGLYISYNSAGEVSLQRKNSGSYFKFESQTSSAKQRYLYREPGSNRTLGIMKRHLHLVNRTFGWSVAVINGEKNACKAKQSDRYVFGDMLTGQSKWFYHSTLPFLNTVSIVHEDYLPAPVQWLSDKSLTYYGYRDFRPISNPSLYITWFNSTDQALLQDNPPLKNRLFESVEISGGDLWMFESPEENFLTDNGQVIQRIQEGNLVLRSQKHASKWRATHLGFCCDGKCYPPTFAYCSNNVKPNTVISKPLV